MTGINNIFVFEADQAANNSTVLADTVVEFKIGANELVVGQMSILGYNAGGGAKLVWSLPAGASAPIAVYGYFSETDTPSFDQFASIASPTVIDSAVAAGATLWNLQGQFYIQNGATPGTIKLQFAQHTAVAVNDLIKAGSFVTVTRL